MRSRVRFGLFVASFISLSLASCSTAPLTPINSVTRHSPVNRTVPTQDTEAAANDIHLRNALPGSWVYEADSIERIESTFFSNGNFEFFHMALTLRGAEERSIKGEWKIEKGRLLVSGIYEKPNNGSHKKLNFGKIVSISEHEFIMVTGDGRRFVLKRKPPEDYLLKEVALKLNLRERLSISADRVMRDFDKECEGLPPARIPDKQVLAGMRSFMAAAFAPERLEQAILRELGARTSPEDIRQALEWYATPLGKKCEELFMKASLPESDTEMEAFMANLRQNPAPPERTKLIQELDRACKITESYVTFSQSMQLAYTMGSMALLPPDKQTPPAKITEDMERNRPMLMVMVEPVVVGKRLYALRSLSTPELKEYVRIMTSDLTKKFGLALDFAFNRAMVEATDRYLKSIKWAVDYEQQRKGKVSGA
ncbi:MAG: DUF2059 domain-containing protein [Syntrophobacteraceae bacterium]